MPSLNVLRLVFASLLGLFFSTSVLADQPTLMLRIFAAAIEHDCGAELDTSEEVLQRIITTVQNAAGQDVYVIDGSRKSCGELHCGSGGCPIMMYRRDSTNLTRLVDTMGWSWSLSSDAKRVSINVDGTECGGKATTPCVTTVDLQTGKKRTFRPR